MVSLPGCMRPLLLQALPLARTAAAAGSVLDDAMLPVTRGQAAAAQMLHQAALLTARGFSTLEMAGLMQCQSVCGTGGTISVHGDTAAVCSFETCA